MSELKKWELLSEENISPSKWFPLFKQHVKLASGKIIDDYYLAKLGDVAMVIPITPSGNFIFVRQYKHGAGALTLEFPAGVIEPNQKPEEAAETELKQETGIVSKNILPLAQLKALPTKNAATLYGYYTTNAVITANQDLDETEEIEVVEISEKEVEEKIMNGEINCSDTIALYMIYKLKKANPQEAK